MAAAGLVKRHWQREDQRRNTITYWHPYTNDSPEVMVEITGCSGWQVLQLSGGVGDLSDVVRIEDAMRHYRQFNDPRLGCLRYSAKT